MSCYLSISGTEFDVDSFVAEANWASFGNKLRIYKMGEYINKLKRRKHRDTGLGLLISDRGFKDMDGQQRDIITFIEQQMDALLLLKSNYKLDGWNCFDVGFDANTPNNFSKTYILQPRMMQLLGQLDIELYITNYYPKQGRVNNRYKRRRWPVKK